MPYSPDTLDKEWKRPTGAFCTPRLASRESPCLTVQHCPHARCNFLHVVVQHHCSLCGRKLGWGRHLKPDPQGSLFGPAWVHVECAAEGLGYSLLRKAREEVRQAAALNRRKVK